MQKTQLAMFPLQLFLLPGETHKLHIFEERYRQLLEDCENINISFGIPYTKNGTITGYGSMVKLKRIISRKRNGAADIEIEATGVFKVRKFFMRMGEKLYPGGHVEFIDTTMITPVGNELFQAFKTYLFKSDSPASTEAFSADLNVFDVARLLFMEDSKKIKLLKVNNIEDMERLVLNEINLRLLLLKQMKSVEHNIYLN
jgi:Lon protease-like protein